MNKIKGFKTIALSIIVTVIGALEAFQWVDVIPDSISAWVVPAIGILFGYLRTITNTAIGKGE